MGNKRRLGIPITDEAKAKLSAALKGRKRPPEVIMKALASRWYNGKLKIMPEFLSGQI